MMENTDSEAHRLSMNLDSERVNLGSESKGLDTITQIRNRLLLRPFRPQMVLTPTGRVIHVPGSSREEENKWVSVFYLSTTGLLLIYITWKI